MICCSMQFQEILPLKPPLFGITPVPAAAAGLPFQE